MRTVVSIRAAIAILCLTLPLAVTACKSGTGGGDEPLLWATVIGVLTRDGQPVAGAHVTARRFNMCPTCDDVVHGGGLSGADGSYRLRMSSYWPVDERYPFVLVTNPPAGSGLRPDTTRFTPILSSRGFDEVQVNIALRAE